MDPQSWPGEPQDEMSLFTSRVKERQFSKPPWSGDSEIHNHRRSDGDHLVPVVGTSGPQECVGGTSKVL